MKWNTQLREASRQGQFNKSLLIFRLMLRSGFIPNAFTFPFIIKSAASLSLPFYGFQLHSHVIKSGSHSEPFVLTSLISMYSKFSLLTKAHQLFDESPHPSKLTVSYNALISGYVQGARFSNGMLLFNQMRMQAVPVTAITLLGLVPGCTLELGTSLFCFNLKWGLKGDVAVANCFLSMFVRCGSVELARKVFDEMDDKELITWNAMISGYSQNGLGNEVMDLYRDMELSGLPPDEVTFVGVLSSCANLAATRIGREMEVEIERRGFGSNPFVKNALISMYARCGNLFKARATFDDMTNKTLISWTTIISAYGMHGYGEVAVELFDQMIGERIRPDKAVFVSVLTACSHAGLTEKGMDYFNAMQSTYNLKPGTEHYSCVVDLLGRAGRLTEARNLIESMPVAPDGPVWGALLGACKIHKDVDLAELSFRKVIELEPTNIGYYVLLSNMYYELGNKEGVLRVRVMMREGGLRKDPGYSYVEYKGKTHLFTAGDRSHGMMKEIYCKLEELDKGCGGADGNEEAIGIHSERLAIAFALLHVERDEDIVVIKNLRICGDCHLFVKLVSKLVDNRFIVRDATRFHHFKGGACSCKDYW